MHQLMPSVSDVIYTETRPDKHFLRELMAVGYYAVWLGGKSEDKRSAESNHHHRLSSGNYPMRFSECGISFEKHPIRIDGCKAGVEVEAKPLSGSVTFKIVAREGPVIDYSFQSIGYTHRIEKRPEWIDSHIEKISAKPFADVVTEARPESQHWGGVGEYPLLVKERNRCTKRYVGREIQNQRNLVFAYVD